MSDGTGRASTDDIGERLIGAKPKPRIIAVGNVPEGVAEYLAAAAPTFSKVDALTGVNQSEWDLVITSGYIDEIAIGLPLVSFVTPDKAIFVLGYRGDELLVEQALSDVRVNEFRTPSSEISAALARLAEQTLIPLYRSDEERRSYFRGRGVAGWSPVVQNSMHQALAVIFRVSEGSGPRLLVPFDVPRPGDWVRSFVLDVLRPEQPELFHKFADWESDDTWMTNEEVAVAQQMKDLKAERDAALKAFAEAEATLDAQMARASRAAESGPRRLLTAQGDELVKAVRTALEEIGFEVEEIDENPERKDEKLEDLQILDGDWVALAEVRGYGGGAKSTDLIRIARFSARYILEHGRAPDGVWYVVNHNMQSPPASRDTPLAANPDDVKVFGQGDGSVIDTRALFKAQRLVAKDPTIASQVRERLKATRETLTDFDLT